MLALAAGFAGAAQARTLSPAEALARVSNDAAKGGAHKAPARLSAKAQLVFTKTAADAEPAVYVYNGGNGGYMLVSADDCALPLLGYSDAGSFPADTTLLPPAMRWWISEYANQIAYARARGLEGGGIKTAVLEGLPAIAPMIKTAWDQGEPYNAQCPTYGSSATYTGCVATAMAQVLNYWQYPEKGKGQISYNAETIQKRLSLNFALKKFDWANMLPAYENGNWTAEQADAVAYLMKACGYAVKMDYGTDSSGALAIYIARGLTRYLDYDPNISYEVRHFYSTTQWNQMIYDNLRDVGPVLYGGGSLIGGGHSFICDGYDGEGLFHFNWGWTGMSDGYFSLDALNPYALGTGGGTGGGYNFTQDAVLGIQPPTGKPAEERQLYLTQTGSLAGVVAIADDGRNILNFDLFAEQQCMWVNYNGVNMKTAFEAVFENQTDPTAAAVYASISDKRVSIDPGYGTTPKAIGAAVDLDALALPDGEYRVYCVHYDPEAENAPRVKMRATYGYFNWLTLKVSGGTYTVVNNDVDRLYVEDGAMEGKMYYGMNATVTVTVGNDSDMEMARGFAPVIVTQEGELALLGESLFITVPAHSKVTRTWTTEIYQMKQYFTVSEETPVFLTFYDESTGNFFDTDLMKPMTLYPNPGTPQISGVTTPAIEGAKRELVIVDGKASYRLKVTNPKEMKITAPLRLDGGVYSYPTYVCVLDTEDPSMEILERVGGPFSFDEGETVKDFKATLDFSRGDPAKIYWLTLAYSTGGGYSQISNTNTLFRIESAGVDDITGDSDLLFSDGSTVRGTGAITVYDLQGTAVADGTDAVSLSGLQPGIYIARCGRKALKIAVR